MHEMVKLNYTKDKGTTRTELFIRLVDSKVRSMGKRKYHESPRSAMRVREEQNE
jgi:hypothetical protein